MDRPNSHAPEFLAPIAVLLALVPPFALCPPLPSREWQRPAPELQAIALEEEPVGPEERRPAWKAPSKIEDEQSWRRLIEEAERVLLATS
jgi:hypothetical protein